MRLSSYLKAITGAIVAGLGALEIAYADDVLTMHEGVTAAVVFFSALGVIWAVPNVPEPPRKP